MGLRRRWTSWAVARAHALVVEVPGWWATRVAVEQDLARRGWQPALSPADADVLVVCGEPGERLAEAIDRVWEQLPGPRARVLVTGPEVSAALDEAGRQLSDEDRQRDDARGRHDPVGGETDQGDGDHGDMDMAPAGIPLAGGDEDRDGLEMDVLHVPLGPVLPYWPPGLVLRCTLHGDVVAEADVDVLDGRGVPPPPPASALPARDVAVACDGAARLLAVAGWDDAAAAARRVRDLVLTDPADGAPPRAAGPAAIARRPLVVVAVAAARAGRARRRRAQVARSTVGDARRRARPAGRDARQGAVRHRWEGGGPPHRPGRRACGPPRIVAGLELGTVRLVVASLVPDTAGVVRRERSHA